MKRFGSEVLWMGHCSSAARWVRFGSEIFSDKFGLVGFVSHGRWQQDGHNFDVSGFVSQIA